ncbi:hypothetical protein Mesil_1926 [Allomeiothermus silvanus DSM 9946]|uniref:Uncharacterized protein n=1 Tax=Allomeiothermus silvanus (strain ATCC 700542 / DSM 9946 / NBRC 106475 / NCIMB 13440 / VI-R2) TaxID=526227 RepID=D7BGI5_ALLS1|nr:hypothetical protein [Allomeiothermus silvanus]ADH63801.1 hypothetical protein Mesil_1926 [Allomeiothermus silvanus DSM 9946]
MSFATVDELPISSGTLTVPRIGRPIAELQLAANRLLLAGESVQMRFADGTTYRMVVRRSGVRGGLVEALLVGGADRLNAWLPSRDYQGVPAALVVQDLLREAGEAAGLLELPTVFTRWVRRAGPAHEALLHVMARLPDRAWRIRADGRVWAGLEAWPAGPEGVVVEAAPARGWYDLLPLPSLEPGVLLTAQLNGEQRLLGRVERVVHQIGPRLRTAVYTGG